MRASSARRSRVMIYHRHEGARSCGGPVDFVAAALELSARGLARHPAMAELFGVPRRSLVPPRAPGQGGVPRRS